MRHLIPVTLALAACASPEIVASEVTILEKVSTEVVVNNTLPGINDLSGVTVATVPESFENDYEYRMFDDLRSLNEAIAKNNATVPVQPSSPEITTTTVGESELVPKWEEEHFLSKESYNTGAKLGVLTVTNPDGQVLVSIPLFSNQNISDTAAYSEQLERGAVLEVAHSDINPDAISDQSGVPLDMGLLGEDGTAVIFGHRLSSINPDWDGNLENGLEGYSQTVFEDIDRIVEGAQAVIQFDESLGREQIAYIFTNIEEFREVENTNGGFNAPSLLNARSGLDDDQYLRLLACTPKGSTRDRIAANFRLMSE